jgi:hypothetical protein
MGLEIATHVNQLVAANPVGNVDNYSTADDHLRLIKTTLVTDFPNIGGVMSASHTELNYVVGVTSAIQTQLNARELTANKNANNGYAGLNASAQLLDARVQQSNVTQHQAALALAASQITSGTFAAARLGGGSATAIVYLRGDQAWAGLDASHLSGGTIPDARFPATLPALNGSNLTSLNGANISSGNIAYARISTNLLASDGAGSTLDADLLDGQQGSFYQNASNLNAGTVPNARLPNIAAMPGVTIASDPGGTPSGSVGQMFFYY